MTAEASSLTSQSPSTRRRCRPPAPSSVARLIRAVRLRRGRCSRWPSAAATFFILMGLTPDRSRRQTTVVTAWSSTARWSSSWSWSSRWELVQPLSGEPPGPGGRAAARSDRRAFQPRRGGRRRVLLAVDRKHHPRPRPRQLVLDADPAIVDTSCRSPRPMSSSRPDQLACRPSGARRRSSRRPARSSPTIPSVPGHPRRRWRIARQLAGRLPRRRRRRADRARRHRRSAERFPAAAASRDRRRPSRRRPDRRAHRARRQQPHRRRSRSLDGYRRSVLYVARPIDPQVARYLGDDRRQRRRVRSA